MDINQLEKNADRPENLDLKRRYGRFYVSAKLVEDHPADALRIMASFLVVRCEYLFQMDRFECAALSPLFRKIEEGEMIPLYDAVIHQNENPETGEIELSVEVKEKTDLCPPA